MSRAEELKAQGKAEAHAELLPLLQEKDDAIASIIAEKDNTIASVIAEKDEIIARLQRQLESNKLTPSKS